MAVGDDFAEFAGAATAPLLRLAWLLTGHREQAQDLVQSALVRTFTRWNRIDRPDALAYTRRIVVNLHTDWLRRRPWREQGHARVPERPAPGDGPEAVLDRAALMAMLRRLSRRERATLVLRYYIDLSEADTARTLGVSVGTGKSVSSRALAKLRQDPEWAGPHRSPEPASAGSNRTALRGTS